ncbi:hypothetical protein OSB04_001375 [Centaurea solstitialis]|uniref:No apical meristem-associated C-terminal domain-containing protein n=1 Tax=Centaurea solstitialis TaxID=347529 RepID=A0AA38TR68_9ASTR|nr:hypothetical protein OSB04_001375 [Centaurea solstitialis]
MSSSIRSSAYKDNEDIQLCHCYLDVSQNPIIGRNQRKDKLWERIEVQYHSCEPFASNRRPRRSLESRMSTIQKATKKLRGCINQVQNRNPSGASEQDIMNEAKEMLKLDASYKRGFKFDHVWHIMKDCENFSTVTETSQSQRHSPYESLSPGLGSSSGTDVGSPSLNLNDEQCTSLTQRPIGVKKKAKSKLQSDKQLESFVEASKRMSEAINKNSEADQDQETNELVLQSTDPDHRSKDLLKTLKSYSKNHQRSHLIGTNRNNVQTERIALDKKLADDRILFTDLNSISDPVFCEYIKNEKNRIIRMRTEEHQTDTYGQGSGYQGSHYRESQHQESEEQIQGSEEGIQKQAEGSQNVAFDQYYATGQNQWSL